MRRILAIAVLTIRAAIRYKAVLVLSIILIGCTAILPLIVKDDGTARGFTQIILTYTLTLATALLGLSTLWLACGILAREIEEAQMQMVAVKPVARWEIWLGKWIGLLGLNAMLLTVVGVGIYATMTWRARSLSPKQQAILRSEVLVARNSAREAVVDYKKEAENILRERIASGLPEGIDIRQARVYVTERVKAQYQVVQPDYMRRWEVPLGDPARLKDAPMFLRVRFDASSGFDQRHETFWEIGPPGSSTSFRTNVFLVPENYTEFPIPPNLFDSQGTLLVNFYNRNQKALIFPIEDGLEVLYRTGGFGLNFIRGLGIIFCWLALLAALGLAGASFLSFPVAAFCAIATLFTVLSSGTLQQVIDEGGIVAVDSNTGLASDQHPLNQISVPAAKALLTLFNLARGFSPIDALSGGRSVTWAELGRAVFQIVIVLGGLLSSIGMLIFTRRELATAQGKG